MNARGQILKKIRSLALKDLPLPSIPVFPNEFELQSLLKQSLLANGAVVVELVKEDVKTYLRNQFVEGLRCISHFEGFEGNVALEGISAPHSLDEIELAIIKADFGVAENGALWINSEGIRYPVLPFIVQHLVVLLDRNQLVATMHEAYEQVNLRDQHFGLFIAGPSKTADIEQSLVIGAHGPLSMTVILI